MSKIDKGTCLSCLGSGQVSSERGIARCPDCEGSGKIGSEIRRSEERLRRIEARNLGKEGDVALDVKWLTVELRRFRDTLMNVMSVAQEGCMDADDASDVTADNELLRRIHFEVNDVLGIYAVTEKKESE